MSEAFVSRRAHAMRRTRFLRGLPAVLLAFVSSVCEPATLPSADAAGSRDHEHLRRYEGSVILSYSQSAFEEFSLPLSALVEVPGESDAKNNVVFRPSSSKHLEGRHTLLVYLMPEGRSTLEVVRNYRD